MTTQLMGNAWPDERRNIVSGPSKWDFAISLFEGDSRGRKCLNFGLEILRLPVPIAHQSVSTVEKALANLSRSEPIMIVIDLASREDGDGEKYNFRGYCPYGVGDNKPFAVTGYYDLKTRKGVIKKI